MDCRKSGTFTSISMEAIYKFHFDCGRQGTLHGLFIADVEKVEKLIKSRAEIYFGEVLGKHSEVFGPLDRCDITKISDKPEDVEVVRRLKLTNGYDPVDRYIEHQGEQGEPSIFDEDEEEKDE